MWKASTRKRRYGKTVTAVSGGNEGRRRIRARRGLRSCEGRRGRRIKGRFGPTKNATVAGNAILPSFPSSKSRNRDNATYRWLGWTNERAIGQGSSSAGSRRRYRRNFSRKGIKPRHFPINILIKSFHRLFDDNRERAVPTRSAGNQGGEHVASASAKKYAAPMCCHPIRNCILTLGNCLPRYSRRRALLFTAVVGSASFHDAFRCYYVDQWDH